MLNTAVVKVIGIALQYSLVILIYFFLFRVVHLVYQDLKKPALSGAISGSNAVTTARLLVVDDGQQAVATDCFLLGETLSIGRHAQNDVVINSSFVSSEHACINRDRRGYWLIDLGSTNGTLVNGQPIKRETLLRAGDMITIGPVTFKFER